MILLSDFDYYATSNKSRLIGIRPVKTHSKTAPNEEGTYQPSAELLFKKAEKVLQEAEVKAQKIQEDARRALLAEQTKWEESKATLEEQAKEKGFLEGYEAGKEEGSNTYTKKIQQAEEIIKTAKLDYQNILTDSEDMILHLALAAASKILNMEIKSGNQYVELVKHAIQEVKDQTKIFVYAHPEDYQSLINQKEELTNIVRFDTDFCIYPDSSLLEGACIIESPYGRIDAGVDSQLQELRNKLFDLSREANSED